MTTGAGAVGGLVAHLGGIGVLIGMTLESVGIPLPSEVIMPLGGALAGTAGALLWVIAAGTLGNLAGSLLAYGIGRGGGARWLRAEHLRHAHAWFQRFGGGAVFVGRLLPVVRTYISFPAGAAAMPLPGFVAYTLAGSLIWSAALAYAGYRLRGAWAHVAAPLEHLAPVIGVLALVVIALLLVRAARRARASRP